MAENEAFRLVAIGLALHLSPNTGNEKRFKRLQIPLRCFPFAIPIESRYVIFLCCVLNFLQSRFVTHKLFVNITLVTVMNCENAKLSSVLCVSS